MATDTFTGWVIGTGADCHIRVPDPYASARHAGIVLDRHGRVFVQDLGSTNGTYVVLPDGSQAKVPLGTCIEIHPGWAVVVGRTRIPWRAK